MSKPKLPVINTENNGSKCSIRKVCKSNCKKCPIYKDFK